MHSRILIYEGFNFGICVYMYTCMYVCMYVVIYLFVYVFFSFLSVCVYVYEAHCFILMKKCGYMSVNMEKIFIWLQWKLMCSQVCLCTCIILGYSSLDFNCKCMEWVQMTRCKYICVSLCMYVMWLSTGECDWINVCGYIYIYSFSFYCI